MVSSTKLPTHIIVIIVLLSTITTFHPSSCETSNSSKNKIKTSDDDDHRNLSGSTKDNSSRRGRPNWKRNNAVIDFEMEGSPSSEELEEQQRPKRGGYYFYGHPHSSNYFDRYFDRDRERDLGRDRGDGHKESQPRQYEKTWGGKVMKKFRHRTNNLINAASAVAFAHENNYPSDEVDVEEDNEAAGTYNLFSSGGYGGGGGYGSAYGKGVNKSAVGLLGFLSLLSLIQNALTTTTAATGRRRRRDTVDGGNSSEITDSETIKPGIETERETQSQKIAEIVLPLFTSFSFAMQEDQVAEQRLKCVLHEVCTTNHLLVSEFGEHGKDVGLMLGNVLESMAKKRLTKGTGSNEPLLKLKYAARSGRNGKSCENHYPKCP